jgi:prepilin-type N-terminal cleavage/methylation domain-containing protein
MKIKKAFTLIELLVVIAIVGILSGFVVVRMNGAINAANDAKKQTDLANIKKALIIYGVQSGNNYPIESNPCTVGSCSTLDSALEGILPQTLNGTYTYQSTDGYSFKAATVLSSGYAYTYNSTTNTFTSEQPSSGICGTANKTYASTDTTYNTDTFCSIGTVSPSSPAFPELGIPTNWTCAGLNGGTTVNCTASRSLNGVCGTSSGSNLSSIPTTNLCTLGTATAVSSAGPWTWSCNGSNGGTNASCSTGSLPVNGACGSSNGSNSSSIPTTNLCTLGNATVINGTGPWTWDCTGLNTGTTANCTANNIINGACGTANKTYAYSDTTYGSDTHCVTGTKTPSTFAFPDQGSSINWTCVGLNTGTTANCTASRGNVPIAGSCGTKNGKYATATPSGTQACTAGTATGMTGSYSWTCAGQNGGASSGTCATIAATYAVQSFTSSTTWTVPANVTSVEYLVVAGGGGGGSAFAGGGGAGGLLTGSNFAVSGSVSVTVGAGGAGASAGGASANGSNSAFGSIVTIGGGGGGGDNNRGGKNGGSGGGTDETLAVGSGTSGQGNNGGQGYPDGVSAATGGGGGGAGAVGGTSTTASVAGNGGNGITSSITGTSVYYAGGGGGGGGTAYSSGGTGGLGGGGNGGGSVSGSNGTNGLGGGGGGGGYNGSYGAGGAGGSGIVVIRYINNY